MVRWMSSARTPQVSGGVPPVFTTPAAIDRAVLEMADVPVILVATTGRLPSPHAVHTSRGDHPVMMRLGHSIGNAAKWSMPRLAGTVSGCVAIVQTEPGSLPRGFGGLLI